jgi:hypothetical protein
VTIREELSEELERLSEQELQETLEYVRSLHGEAERNGAIEPALLAQSALAKDWSTPEEDAAWKDL